jgi:hypothetical protein
MEIIYMSDVIFILSHSPLFFDTIDQHNNSLAKRRYTWRADTSARLVMVFIIGL